VFLDHLRLYPRLRRSERARRRKHRCDDRNFDHGQCGRREFPGSITACLSDRRWLRRLWPPIRRRDHRGLLQQSAVRWVLRCAR
jgi:hypothetical protein